MPPSPSSFPQQVDDIKSIEEEVEPDDRDGLDVPRDVLSLPVHGHHVHCIRFQRSHLLRTFQQLTHNLTQQVLADNKYHYDE